MGMSAGSAKSGGRRGRRGRGNSPISEINVTPLVDVMLVLLIVFMVAAPLMTMGVPVDLPQTRAKAMPVDAKPITVTVTPDGAISIDNEPVAIDALVSTVQSLANQGTDERLYVRGDSTAQYGMIMQVMGALSGAGFDKIGLITEQQQAP
ncbi:MAG: ExbD [Devosia sp.]|uniref:protein TolR n=1 Tax=Devosia sp. TaxID=1871048 RepID=UPI0026216DA2|nr:protein TolR [Devosia sp.]MDB5529780.1 ExbD [Devosia sp.]